MCGRFTQNYSWQEVRDFLDLFGEPRNLRPRYNVAPTTIVDVVRLDDQGRRYMTQMRWGLVPVWWKEPLNKLPATFNARVEGLEKSGMFREPYKRRRCIVPVSGFYEWTGPKANRQPHLFTAADGSPLIALAGLWDSWKDAATGDEILSCTLITTGANEWMKPYHHRMPATIAQANIDRWLRGEMMKDELEPAPEAKFNERKASKRMNKTGVGDDDPTILESEEMDL
jgi:putative SOS response-associated peptidase YedK